MAGCPGARTGADEVAKVRPEKTPHHRCAELPLKGEAIGPGCPNKAGVGSWPAFCGSSKLLPYKANWAGNMRIQSLLLEEKVASGVSRKPDDG